jgi:CRISPR-associated protein Csy1
MSKVSEQLLAEASHLLQQGHVASARTKLEQLTAVAATSRPAWYLLALACVRGGDHASARRAIERTVSLGQPDGNTLLMASNICQDLGDAESAFQYAADAAEVVPAFAQGINNFGILLADRQRFHESIAAFERAISIKPDYARAYANLAATLLKVERYSDALRNAERAAALQPDYAHAHYTRAAAAFPLGKTEYALAALQAALTREARLVEAWVLLARIHRLDGRVAEAAEALKRAIGLAPQRVDVKIMWADLLWIDGRFDQARALWNEVLSIQPAQLEATMRLALALPGIYADEAAVDAARQRFVDGVTALHEKTPLLASGPKFEVLRDLQSSNFFLAYQARDDKNLQREFAAFVAALLKPHLPQFFAPLPARVAAKRVRVGFVSRFFHVSTAGNYFASWVTDLAQDEFEVVVFYTNHRSDSLTELVRSRADQFFQQDPPLETLASIVKDAALDVLVYPELGMEAKTFALAALRLAPVQVCGWGHPVTPGHANIDYYLSCALMEPADAARHYNEKLLLLPGLGTRYPAPLAPDGDIGKKQRADFQLPERKTLYLLPQSLFKIHPHNDALITQLLARDPDGVLIMFATAYPAWTQAFLLRLQRAFATAGLAPEGRVKVLPNLSHDEYKRVNQLCDVMIDTLYWSGGNTSLDALAMGLPIVTLPGEFMRGRQSAAMLSMAGLDELIATDEQNYLDIAYKLGTDNAYRNDVRKRIIEKRHRIFDDARPTSEFAAFLRKVTGGSP